MSHLVTIQAKVTDPVAIAAACRRIGLPTAVQGTARLFSGEATGLLLRLPDWHYPAVIDTSTGEIRCDTYEGRWGEQRHLDRFLQLYAVEAAKIQAHKKGYTATLQTLQDGSIKVQIIERAA